MTDNHSAEGDVASSTTQLQTFTLDDLWKDPRLVAIDSLVYDITGFAKVHPGGSGPLLAAGGTDVTALFRSMHRRQPKDVERYREVLSKYRVGVLSPAVKNMEFDSEFAQDLYREVCETVPPALWFAPTGFWVRTALIVVGTLLAELGWILTGSWQLCVLVGVLHAQIGLAVQHDASHGAVSRNWRWNSALAYGADWIGNTRWLWFEQHIIGHHPNTNADMDPDASSAEPFLLFRTVDYSLRKAYHRFQHWFMYPVLSLYGPSVVYNLPQLLTLNHNDEVPVKNNKFLQKQLLPSILFRLFYYVRVILLPLYIGGAPLWLALLGVNFVTGFCLTFVFVLSHNFVGSCRFPERDQNDWYKMQVETSCTYGGFVSGLMTGGLNFQIEHHLFPRLNSYWYPTIAPVVRRVCAKHGVQYTYYPTIIHNMRSTIEFMRLNGISKVRVD